jgi:hypothetical protein
MADATTTANAKKGSMPRWLTNTFNAMIAGIFRAPSDAAKIPHTHTEVADELHGTTKSFLLPGGASISSGINPTKGAEMLQNYFYGILKTLGGSLGGAVMAMVGGKKQQSQVKDTAANTMQSFRDVATEALKATGTAWNSLIAFFSARSLKTSNAH